MADVCKTVLQKDAMAVVTASSIAALVSDPRGRAALTHLLTVPDSQLTAAAETVFRMMAPAPVVMVKEGGKASRVSSRPDVDALAQLVAQLRTEVLHHPRPEVAVKGTAQWNALTRLSDRLSPWRGGRDDAAWRSALRASLLPWMQGLKARRVSFGHNLFNNDDQVAAIEEHFVSLKRLADFPRPWQEMRKAWCAFTGHSAGTCDTTTHRLDCLAACERMLEAVDVDEGDAAWASACQGWVACHLGAAKEAGGAITWAAQRGWLTSANAVDRMTASLSGPQVAAETVPLGKLIRRF
jgi:hypothetical protein